MSGKEETAVKEEDEVGVTTRLNNMNLLGLPMFRLAAAQDTRETTPQRKTIRGSRTTMMLISRVKGE